MIKISRISSPLKDKLKNLETCSQLDGDGVFEGKYNTSGSVLIRNKFIGEISADQIIVDENGQLEGEIKSTELIISGDVKGNIISDSIVIMETGKLSGNITYKQIAVFEGGIINVDGMKQIEEKEDKIVKITSKV
jgi:cytoskeletal protein CcmA (bactofilin family)